MTDDVIDLNKARLQGYYARQQKHDPDYPQKLRERMAPRALEICEMLLPAGKLVGRKEWWIGSVRGEAGDSLKITLYGPKAGLGHDFATNEGFDLITIWRNVRGYTAPGDFMRACDEIEKWLGTSTPTADWIIQARVKHEKAPPLGEPTARYVYTDAAGKELLHIYRYEADGKKSFRQFDPQANVWKSPPGLKPLYNQAGIAKAAEVVLVEGEKAADALIAAGYCATTPPGGANVDAALVDWAPLTGKRVTIWPDADEPGAKAGAAWRAALSRLATVTVAEPPAGVAKGWDAADALAEGFDVKAHLASAAAPKARIFPTLDLDGLAALKPPQFIIDGWIVKNGLAMLYGAPGSLKSFAALDFALSLAYGKPWQGNRVRPTGVLYVAGEGAAGLAKRVGAWRKYHGLEHKTAPFRLLSAAVNMMDEVEVTILIDTLKAVMEADGGDYGLVIVDTVARAMPGAEENSAKDMGLFVAGLDRVRLEIGCAGLGVHHSGKDATKGLRGSSALLGAADTVIVAKRTETLVTLEMEKQKDAEEAEPLTLKTETIFVKGTDDPFDLNKKVTSLVLVETDERPARPTVSDPYLALIVELLETDASPTRPVTDEIPAEKPVLHRNILQQNAFERRFSDTDSRKSSDDSVNRRLRQLRDKGLIGIFEHYLWVK